MQVDRKLKQELMEKISDFYDSVPVYSIKKLSNNEIIDNAKYYASRFMGGNSPATFKSIEKHDDLMLINLPWDTKMWVYNNSNAITITRRMKPLEHLINENIDVSRLGLIAIEKMKKLKMDKWKLSFEELKFESLGQIKAFGINVQETRSPSILCRIIGVFRRYINEIPVYGRASISLKIAGGDILESIGVDWRLIEEHPVEYTKIIDVEIAAENIINELNSTSPSRILTLDDYSPILFTLAYMSMPKRRPQNYMQPVYIAIFKPLRNTTLGHVITIPATTKNYESIQIPPTETKFGG